MSDQRLEQLKIIVVDDDPSNLMALSFAIKSFGMNSTSSSGGIDALAQIAGDKFDLILLDIDMPGMSGFEVCRLLRQDVNTQSIPIIFVSGNVCEKTEIHAIALGCYFLAKPYGLVDLKSAILKALSDEGEA